MWWWKANFHAALFTSCITVSVFLGEVLFVCVKAGKTGREGSETLPKIQTTLISQLCLHLTYRHFALGHVGNTHVMAAGLNQKKRLMKLSLPASWRYISSGTPEMNAGAPLLLALINWLQITSWPYSFGSAESNRAVTSMGSAGNLCVLCFCTQILKTGIPGLAQMVMQSKIIMEVCLMKVANGFFVFFYVVWSAACSFFSVSYCSCTFLHKLRPMMMTSLGKPSILATSKHPSLL